MIKSKLEINQQGTKRWFNSKKQYHRENGPAIIYLDGEMHWFINDKSHRIDGPAWILNDSYKDWYLDNSYIRSFQYD